MAYELDLDDPVGESAVDVIESQVGSALEDLAVVADGGAATAVAEAVHDARKRAKKVRAVARLVRDAVGSDAYHAVNDPARDAARRLSAVRDAQVLGETLDELFAWAKAHDVVDVDRRRHQAARLEVDRRFEAVLATSGVAHDAADAGALIESAMVAAERWSVPDGFDALAGGLARTYRRGRDGWARAGKERTDDALHEWRKRVKYGWYHLRLLRPAAPDVLGDEARRFHQLADLLGDDHDLAVLVGELADDPEAWGGDERASELTDLAGTRRYALQADALDLGRQLYARKPKHWVRHLARLWSS